MNFFDVTPMGRILNRFSRDINAVDEAIPSIMSNFLRVFIGLMEVVVVILYTMPVSTVVVVPLGIMYIYLQVSNPSAFLLYLLSFGVHLK